MGTLIRILLAAWIGSLFLTGCSGTRVSFATTDFKKSEYRNSNIALLPVAVNPAFDANLVPTAGLQKAALDQMRWVGMARPHQVEKEALESAGIEIAFPWTPSRIAKAAHALGFDAGVAISVASIAKERKNHDASIDLFVAFADATDENAKRWTLAGSWYAKSASNLARAVQSNLGFHLIDLQFYQRDRDIIMSAGGVPYRVTQPLIAVASADWSLVKDAGSVKTKKLSLFITAVHDAGLASVIVTNKQAAFRRVLYAQPNYYASAQGLNQKAIYVSSPVEVPLVTGSNSVTVQAQPLEGEQSARELNVISTVQPEVEFIASAVGAYDNFGTLSQAQDSMLAFARAASRRGLQPIALSVAVDPSRLDLLSNLAELLRQSAPDDAVVIYYAGRAGVGAVTADSESVTADSNISVDSTEAAVFLLKDAPSARPLLGSVPISDLRTILARRRGLALLDLCNDQPDDSMRESIQKALPSQAIVVLRPCSAGLGIIAKTSMARLRAKSLITEDGIEDLLRDVSHEVPDAFRGTGVSTQSVGYSRIQQ